MTSVYNAASYLARLIKRGMGGYRLKIGTRCLESLRPQGRTLDLELPHLGDEIAGDGKEEAFLRASDTDEPA